MSRGDDIEFPSVSLDVCLHTQEYFEVRVFIRRSVYTGNVVINGWGRHPLNFNNTEGSEFFP